MKTERELFEVWCYRCDIDTSRYNLIGNQRYKDSTVEAYWEGWKASANRQGYKLVPIEPTIDMIKAYYSTPKPTAERCYKSMIAAVN